MKKLYTLLMVLVMTASLTLNASNARDGESVLTVNPDPVDLGLRASGAWMDPLTIELGTTGEEYTIYSIKSLDPFFIVVDVYFPPTVTTEETYQTDIYHGESDVEGEITGKIVVEHTLGIDTIEVKATVYFPEEKDVWETASEITLPFTETASVEGFENNYSLIAEGADIVYKAVFEEDAIIFANIEGENSALAIYQEGFDGYGGPRENNFYKPEIAEDKNAEIIFSYDFNDGKPTGWGVFENDGDGNHWNLSQAGNSFTCGPDESIAIYSYTQYYGNLTPDNYIVTSSKYAITKKSVLSWDAKSSDLSTFYNKEHYAVVVSTDKKEWEIVWETTINYTGFKHEMVSLEKYEGQEVYVGFRHFNCSGEDATTLVIDNIVLANTSINGVGIQNAILPAGTYYFVISAAGEYTVDIRLASDVDVESIEELSKSFNIYPNPVNDILYIEAEAQVENVVVYDIFGRHQLEVSGQQSAISVANFNNGVYFVKVRTENGEVIKRFVKK